MRRELAVEEHRDARLGSDSARRREGLRPGGLAVVLVEPDDRADVEGADARMRARRASHVDRVDACPSAVDERAASEPARPAQGENACGCEPSPSGCRGARRRLRTRPRWRSIRRASRPSEKFGTASSTRRRPLRRAARRRGRPARPSTARVGLHHDAVEVDRHLDRRRRSRPRRRTRRGTCPSSFSSSSSSPLRIAFSLVPMPSSATRVPSGPCAVSSSSARSPISPVAATQLRRPRP